MVLLTVIGLLVGLILIGIPWINGCLDLYMAWRFSRHHGTDRTAAPLNWNALKWSLLHNLDEIAEKIPFVRKDLSEIFGIREDDGRIT